MTKFDTAALESAANGESIDSDKHDTDAVATDGGMIVAGDDGEILDNGPTYTYHTEPSYVGGARYVRCEECGAECVPAEPDRLAHHAGCSERRD